MDLNDFLKDGLVKDSAVLFLVLLIICIIYALVQEIRRTRQLMGYEQTQGKVVKSLLISDQYDEDGVVYTSDIVYEFEVDGEKYTGQNIGATSQSESNESFHQGLVERYPKDEEVTVFYQVSDPEHCILQPRLRDRLLGIALGVFLTLSLSLFAYHLANPFQAKLSASSGEQPQPTNSIQVVNQEQPKESESAPFLFDRTIKRKERPYAANCEQFPVTCLRRPTTNVPIIMGRRDPRIKLSKRYR